MTGSALSRRSLLSGAAAATAVVAVGTRPAEAAPTVTDVVVVGAGLAGLMTARRLVAAGKRVVVLEARDRVGGRTLNHPLPNGKVADLGGTWIGDTQNAVAALAKELGLATFAQFNTGNNIYYHDDTVTPYASDGVTGGAPPDPVILADVVAVTTLLDQMATTVPVSAPWTAPKALEWDSQTLDTWLKANTATEQARKVAAAALQSLFGAEARELSLLYTVWYVATSGDPDNPGTFERLIDVKGGAQARRFVDGAQTMSLRMAAALGDRVKLSAPVRRIAQTADGVVVTSDAVTVRAARVVVAIPPTLAGRIDYSPALPAGRDHYTQRSPQGALMKVEALYDRPFWRTAGFTGAVVSTQGPGGICYDVTPASGTPGGLLAFVGGDQARAYAGQPDKLKKAVLAEFAACFGASAAAPREVLVQDWSREIWSRGCPVHVPAPGTLTSARDAIVRPVGRIHWAGTETATYWHGYMDGAISSGQRAAAEVLAALRSGAAPDVEQ